MRKYKKRPYQEEAIKKIVNAFSGNIKRFYISLPTGSGKNYTTSRAIKDILDKDEDTRIIFIYPSWLLAHQGAMELFSVAPELKELSGRLSNNASKEFKRDLEEDAGAQFLFTTLHTLYSHIKDGNNNRIKRPQLVVIDEFHWGEEAMMREEVENWINRGRSHDTKFLGLSATANSQTDFEEIYRVSIGALTPKYLAEPKIETPFTNVTYHPDYINLDEDEIGQNIEEESENYINLGRNKKRNKFIMNYLEGHYVRLKKILVFCTDKEHCDDLYNLCKLPNKYKYYTGSPKGHFKKFKDCESGIMFTVRKAVHGVDIPDLKTVAVARPIMSKRSQVQITGRGTRNNDGKKSFFYLVEFTDNIKRLGDPAEYNPKFICKNATYNRTRTYKQPSYDHFNYDSSKDFFTFSYSSGDETPIELRLPFREGTSVGYELEFTKGKFGSFDEDDWYENPQWKKEAWRLHNVVKDAVGHYKMSKEPKDYFNYSVPKNYKKWYSEWDSSCGWEVTSRILQDNDGMNELADAVTAIRRLVDTMGEKSLKDDANYFRINGATGLHINLGYKFKNGQHLRNFLHLTRYLEPAILSLCPPSRSYGFEGTKNEYQLEKMPDYCEPLRYRLTHSKIESFKNLHDFTKFVDIEVKKARAKEEAPPMKYWGINFENYRSDNVNPHLEIRYHGSSVDVKNIFLYTSLWMHICHASEHLEPGSFDKNYPREHTGPLKGEEGDIVLLAKELLGANHILLSSLHRRRLELKESWTKAIDIETYMKECYQKWDERFQEIANEWDESEYFQSVAVSQERSKKDFKHFTDFKFKEQTFIATKLVKENKLDNNPNATRKKLSDNTLYAWLSSDQKQIQCIGYKSVPKKIRDKIINTFNKKEGKLLVNGKFFSQFIKNVKMDFLKEQGWALNISNQNQKNKTRWGEMIKQFKEDLAEAGYGHLNLISLRRKDNSNANQFASKNGFVDIMEFKSPWHGGENTLVLSLYGYFSYETIEQSSTKKKHKKSGQESAFLTPLTPSPELAIIVGRKPLPRTQAVKRIWDYIKTHKLQNPRNRRNIIADDNLKRIFKKREFTMFELAKIINKHLS